MLTLVMLAIVLVMRFFLTPEITQLGRVIDFAAPGVPAADRTRFWTFHGAYSASELVKIGLGILLVVLLIWRPNRSHSAEIDAGR